MVHGVEPLEVVKVAVLVAPPVVLPVVEVVLPVVELVLVGVELVVLFLQAKPITMASANVAVRAKIFFIAFCFLVIIKSN